MIASKLQVKTILDFGSGSGRTVKWLRDRGFSSYGIDVEEAYVEKANSLLGPGAVHLVRSGRSDFEDGAFDLVVSDQVLEHVRNGEEAVAEISRLTRSGGYSVHMFPSALRPQELHIKQPFVHWMKSAPLQYAAIKALLRMGIGATYFRDYSLADQAHIFQTFLQTEVAYRTPGTWKQLFEKHGFDVCIASESDLVAWAHGNSSDLLSARHPLSPRSAFTRNCKQTVLLARKRQADTPI